MIERLINDPAFLPITIIFLVLSVYAVWQKLDRFILPLAIMYIVYAFITGLSTADEDTSLKPVQIVEEQTIINSLIKDNIELYFRPILNLQTDKIDIYEISVKLHSNDGNTLLPKHFLPVINRHNLGERYDTIIYSKVLELLPLIDDNISLSFNLSPFSLRKESFHQMMATKLKEGRVDAQRVIIELYEKKTHHRLENYLGILSNLKKYGFRFCLDNFGSSNASMEYIKYFSFDMVQFDREYISGIDDEKHLSIFTSLVKMVKELNIVTIAKWVDNQKTIEKLKKIDIDYIQGFSVGKVLRENELIEFYNPIKDEESSK